MKRYGSMIRLRLEKYEEYKRLHAAAWPEILAKITECGIRRLICGLKPESISLYWVFKQNQHLLRDCQNPPRRDTFRDTSEHTFSAMQASCSLHFSV